MSLVANGPAHQAIHEAIAQLDNAHDAILGLGTLSESFLNLTTLREDAQDAPRTHTPWGAKAAQGSRPNMEDAYSVQLTPPCGNSAGQHTAPAADVSDVHAAPAGTPGLQDIQAPLLPEDLAVLSVFDGHGGPDVAEHCRTNLHKHFAHQLSLQRLGPSTPDGATESNGDDQNGQSTSGARAEFSDSPTTLALLQCQDGGESYSISHVGEALRAAFARTDQELAGTEAGDYVGATAVVAVVGKTHIWVAHCGDSRAVIQRSGEAEALTRDHKPEREDEAARIKAAGGRIVYNSGSHRVMGMLAMSRAIGDHFLRPYIIAEPEVACIERTPHDEVLVLATDGLWDVFSCKEATTLAMRCITRSKDRGMSRHGACRVAASVLTKVALERGSRDNITVIVVDITVPAPSHGVPGATAPQARVSAGGAQAPMPAPGAAKPPRPSQQGDALSSAAADAAGAESHADAQPAPQGAGGVQPGKGSAGHEGSGPAAGGSSSGTGAPGPSTRPPSGSGAANSSTGGAPHGRGMGQRTQSFSVGTCLWLKGHSSSFGGSSGPNTSAAAESASGATGPVPSPSRCDVGERAIERQRSAPQRPVHQSRSGDLLVGGAGTGVNLEEANGSGSSSGVVSGTHTSTRTPTRSGSPGRTRGPERAAPPSRLGPGGFISTSVLQQAGAGASASAHASPAPASPVSPIVRALRKEQAVAAGLGPSGSAGSSGPPSSRSSDNGDVGGGGLGDSAVCSGRLSSENGVGPSGSARRGRKSARRGVGDGERSSAGDKGAKGEVGEVAAEPPSRLDLLSDDQGCQAANMTV